MEKVLSDFVKALRNSNVRVSPAETLDAVSVLNTVGYDDKELLKKSLSIVLPKTPDEKEKFETCFPLPQQTKSYASFVLSHLLSLSIE